MGSPRCPGVGLFKNPLEEVAIPIPNPPQLTPFCGEEQQLHPDLRLDDGTVETNAGRFKDVTNQGQAQVLLGLLATRAIKNVTSRFPLSMFCLLSPDIWKNILHH